MGKVTVLEHPLIQHKISMLRNKETGEKEFREILQEIAIMTFYEAVRDASVIDAEVETPMGKAAVKNIDRKFGIVPILRAGIGMVDGILSLTPTAKVGHIGLYRDPETLLPVEYYCKLPYDASEREIFALDPMLATGGTASAALSFIKDRGVSRIKFLCVISCPEGISKLQHDHPDVDIYTSAIDQGLNEHGYIIPGLGDAGDRLYGTK